MTKLTKIRELVSKYQEPNSHVARMQIRQEKLRKLINEYGVETVALAGGYNVTTLNSYMRMKLPTNIGGDSLIQAEYVLSRL